MVGVAVLGKVAMPDDGREGVAGDQGCGGAGEIDGKAMDRSCVVPRWSFAGRHPAQENVVDRCRGPTAHLMARDLPE